MANKGEIYSIIVPAETPNLTAHTYSEIYGGSAGCTIVINGVSLAIGASSNINVWVKSVSGGTGCYLLGERSNVYTGTQIL